MSIDFSINTLLQNRLFHPASPRIRISSSILATTVQSHSRAMSWSCTHCTFLNPPSQKLSCQICLSPSPSPTPSSPASSSSSAAMWSCRACTLMNAYNKSNCELCDARAPTLSLSAFDDIVATADDSSVGDVFLPLLRPCKRTRVSDPVRVDTEPDRSTGPVSEVSDGCMTQLEDADSSVGLKTVKVLSYNVWFREDLELQKRMKALGDLIELHSPEIICFQEVTPNIFSIFQGFSWWKVYNCSVSRQTSRLNPYFCMQLSKLPVKAFTSRPFGNSIMGRELCVAEVKVNNNKQLTVATSHLESPCPAPPKWDQMYSKERVDQAKEAVDFLKKSQNVIFAGDMNWDDKLDGRFPLSDGWVDAWEELKPGDSGWTYDTKSNKMLTGNRTLQKRLDRFVCKFEDFEISKIEMIGTDVIPDASYVKEKKVKKEIKKLELPVLPSDHYGLLLTICRR